MQRSALTSSSHWPSIIAAVAQRTRSATSVGILLLLAGCSHGETEPRYVHPATVPIARNAPWRAVMQDWFDKGRIDGRYPCAVARAAVRHLPMDAPEIGTPVYAYERKVC